MTIVSSERAAALEIPFRGDGPGEEDRISASPRDPEHPAVLSGQKEQQVVTAILSWPRRWALSPLPWEWSARG